MSYSGYANWETWNYALWIDNEEGSWEHVNELARAALDAAGFDVVETEEEREQAKIEAIRNFSEELKDQAEAEMPDVSGFWMDALNHTVGMVDWDELATHWIEAVIENVA